MECFGVGGVGCEGYDRPFKTECLQTSPLNSSTRYHQLGPLK